MSNREEAERLALLPRIGLIEEALAAAEHRGRNAGIEDCAVACVAVADGASAMADEHLDSYTAYSNQSVGADNCVDACRALLSNPATPVGEVVECEHHRTDKMQYLDADKSFIGCLDCGATSADGGGVAVSILVLDDDPDAVETLAEVLTASGLTVRAYTDARQALTGLDGVTLAIVDMQMPTMDGAEWIRAARKVRGGIRFLLMSGADVAGVAEELRCAWIGKPFEADQIVGVAARLSR